MADSFPILGIDFIEFFVGNARHAARFYEALGFRPLAYRGLETGSRDATSWCVQQGEIRLIFTGAVSSESPISDHVRRHGDAVKAIGLRVPDAFTAYEHAISHGAVRVRQPHRLDDRSTAAEAVIEAYGDVVHPLVSYEGHGPALPPDFHSRFTGRHASADVGLVDIDHVVAAVGLGETDQLQAFYHDVMGFGTLQAFGDDRINTEYSALMQKVVTAGEGKVKFPIVEPAVRSRRSQIEEYLEYHGGPGVQHIAFRSEECVKSVEAMRRNGIEFLSVPDSYYERLPLRVPEIVDRIDDVHRNHILVDKDEDGYLLQIFSKPLQDRPTFFIEVIERQRARGFGEGNIKALFEAIEAEQAVRGNL